MKFLAVGGPLNGQVVELSDKSQSMTVSTETKTFNYFRINLDNAAVMQVDGEA
jgi:hypothetical protein